MSKRESESDFEGSASKLMKMDDHEDGGTSGRSGRVRKKSAKVLEMEEFEQVEKTQQVTKKTKTPKPSQPDESEVGFSEKVKSAKKIKLPKVPNSEVTPVTTKKMKTTIPAVKPVQHLTPMHTNDQLKTQTVMTPTDLLALTIKQESELDLVHHQPTNVNTDDHKSVIKYLLSSPTSTAKMSASTSILTKLSSPPIDGLDTVTPVKKVVKKIKPEKTKEKTGVKVKKEKIEEASSPPGLDPPQGLKMKIFSSSDPLSAQVALTGQPKPKKPGKKKKQALADQSISGESQILASELQILNELSPLSPPAKKTPKKASKKKEKLIQEAISAAQQMPNVVALVAGQNVAGAVQGTLDTPTVKVAKKKKIKIKTKTISTFCSVSSSSFNNVYRDSSTGLDQSDLMEDGDDDDDEMNLVISETENRKKKPHGKKKGLLTKEKSDSITPKGDKLESKFSKRAPTAYMLFCNTHRPNIVNENPGIEFAAISRKLGEMWQTLSNKQKLQWRRKAQRRRKKGSNLISTGKAGRESGNPTALLSTSVTATPTNKLAAFIHKAQKSSPEEAPLSPTKSGDQNLSIEPIDVAAHLKLLGESLSIIGMRLQEHKGMIAVQGSLSVLLDSLLCACGPLLCLTQQVPGMDGCSPSVHSQTLDSVAYVMPGL
ncbi:unnamed protein product [Lymnaea stagnalis]|uniref:HMG box domain-containing protein n=1 Tax=Lymnaea stagnalis TaxID=6523 RepID=A0AAV2IL50_LYMST